MSVEFKIPKTIKLWYIMRNVNYRYRSFQGEKLQNYLKNDRLEILYQLLYLRDDIFIIGCYIF